jgi:hypothetical protein
MDGKGTLRQRMTNSDLVNHDVMKVMRQIACLSAVYGWAAVAISNRHPETSQSLKSDFLMLPHQGETAFGLLLRWQYLTLPKSSTDFTWIMYPTLGSTVPCAYTAAN